MPFGFMWDGEKARGNVTDRKNLLTGSKKRSADVETKPEAVEHGSKKVKLAKSAAEQERW